MNQHDELDELFEAARNVESQVGISEIKSTLSKHVAAGATGASAKAGMSWLLFSMGIIVVLGASVYFWSESGTTETKARKSNAATRDVQVASTNQMPQEFLALLADTVSELNLPKKKLHKQKSDEAEQVVVNITEEDVDSSEKKITFVSRNANVTTHQLLSLIEEATVSDSVFGTQGDSAAEKGEEELTAEVKLRHVDFRISQNTTPEEIQTMVTRCREFGVTLVCVKPKWKKKVLRRFHVQILDRRNILKLNEKQEHDQDDKYSYRFGFDVDENNAAVNFYSGRRPRRSKEDKDGMVFQ